MIDKINYLETKTERFPLVFTLNVMESIKKNMVQLRNGQSKDELDIKALKFFMTEAINEGIEIENEKLNEKRKAVTSKQVGRILTEVGLSGSANKIMNTISESIQTEETSKNALCTKNRME